jgi:hypothetical protein
MISLPVISNKRKQFISKFQKLTHNAAGMVFVMFFNNIWNGTSRYSANKLMLTKEEKTKRVTLNVTP